METSVLQQIQAELKAPKNQYNSFGKYTYRNAEDIQESLKPILAKHGHSVIIYDDIVQVGGRIYVKATVELIDPANKEVAKTVAFAREPESRKGMDDAQVTGATSSYARKYALGGMFLLDDTKDADANEPKPEPKPPEKKDSTYQKYLDAMASVKKELSAFETGEDGYYKALEIHGAKHANEIKDVNLGRQIYKDLSVFLSTLKPKP